MLRTQKYWMIAPLVLASALHAGNTVADGTVLPQAVGGECKAVHQQAMSLLGEGKNAEAETLLASTAARLDVSNASLKDKVCLGVTFDYLTYALERVGKFTAAEEAARRSVAILEEVQGTKAILLNHPLQVLAEFAVRRGDFNRAEKLVSRLESLPPDTPYRPGVKGLRAAILYHSGKLEDAERAYEDTIAEWRKNNNGNQREIVPEMPDLAMVYIRRGRIPDAIKLLEFCSQAKTPAYDLNFRVTIMAGMAIAYAANNEREKSDRYFVSALKFIENEQLFIRPELARDVYFVYAIHLRNTGRKRQATAVQAKAKSLFGPDTSGLVVDVQTLKLKPE